MTHPHTPFGTQPPPGEDTVVAHAQRFEGETVMTHGAAMTSTIQAQSQDRLRGLLDRIKAATGPDRSVDRDIAEHVAAIPFRSTKRGREWFEDSHGGVETWLRHPPAYSCSVDVALALAERSLGNGWFGVMLDAVRELGTRGTEPPTALPRYIIAALLTALIAKGEAP